MTVSEDLGSVWILAGALHSPSMSPFNIFVIFRLVSMASKADPTLWTMFSTAKPLSLED